MQYEEAVRYIADIPKFTKKHPSRHTREFLKRLGNPCSGARVLHIAGTNGKGSVCAFLQAFLLCEGKKTGMFTSPHLETVRERIVCDGQMVSREEFTSVFTEVKETAVEMEKEGLGHPSYFEFLYGMAMKVFARAGEEYLILETGLGGRLDATNSFETPCVSVITSIGMDHTEILGDTLEKIAAEKAGIIRPQVPVFFADNGDVSAQVIRKTAAKTGAPCRGISKDAVKIQEITDKHIAFFTGSEYDSNTPWEVRGTGIYQTYNASLAIAAAGYVLGKEGHPSQWKKALARVQWPARMEEILPGVIVDGAHNLAAVEQFTDSICAQQEYRRRSGLPEEEITVLFSAVEDKDYEEMIALLGTKIRARAFVIARIQDRRGARTEDLVQVFRRYTDSPVLAEELPERAFALAMERRGEKGTLYCLGSLYLAGEIKSLLREGRLVRE